jgi:hydroxyacylglutathione hydrolase
MSDQNDFMVTKIVVTPLEQNCRILTSNGSKKEVVIIDPGGDVSQIIEVLSRDNLSPTSIWLTHSHLDHCGAVADLLSAYPSCLLYGHKSERVFRNLVEQNAKAYGMTTSGFKNCPEPSRYFREGDVLFCGDESFKVLFTPGHSPGHLCFYHARRNLLFAGDTLFAGSVGRSDLPLGDEAVLLRSIHSQLLVLPDSTHVLPGHGSDTTIGKERLSNPFLVA